jgi:hypothetical protein
MKRFSVHFIVHTPIQIVFLNNFKNCRCMPTCASNPWAEETFGFDDVLFEKDCFTRSKVGLLQHTHKGHKDFQTISCTVVNPPI